MKLVVILIDEITKLFKFFDGFSVIPTDITTPF